MQRGRGQGQLRAAHGMSWLLFLVFGITHPEQFINRLVLVAIDRVENGLACEWPISCVDDTEKRRVPPTE